MKYSGQYLQASLEDYLRGSYEESEYSGNIEKNI